MRFIRTIVAMLMLLWTVSAQAGEEGVRSSEALSQPQPKAVAGRDYKLIDPPQPVSAGNKVEVLEFFFYGCSHCYHLHPFLSAWEKKKPADADLQLVPVIFRDEWEPMARTYYALEGMGQIGKLHDPLFEAWNVFNKYLTSEAQAAEFVASRGVDRAKFSAAYNSFAVGSKVMRGKQMLQSYGIRGTPTIVVDGRYLITGLQPEDTIRVLDEVIKVARKERSRR